MKKQLALLVILLVTVTAQAAPRYVFLFIGDGMGTCQRRTAEAYARANGDAPLLINSLPVSGMMHTSPADRRVTDSAAAITAMASGRKTYNGIIGMATNKQTCLESLGKIAKARGMKVGIVTSVSIDHATPAGFYANVTSRNDVKEITRQMIASGFDYFAGASRAAETQVAADGHPLAAAREAGYTIAATPETLAACTPADGRVWAFSPVLDNKSALPYAMDNAPGGIPLGDFTRKGIELLDNPGGFFMMVEGGKIDWACHANDGAACIGDTLAFDRAVQVAHAFYRQHPDDTLIVVTADHETGGMACKTFNAAPIRGQQASHAVLQQHLAPLAKTRKPFSAVQALLAETCGLSDLTAEEQARLKKAWQQTLTGKTSKKGLYGAGGFSAACIQVVNDRAGISWSSKGHTGVDVQTTAVGVGAESFGGTYDNTDLFKKLLGALPTPR